MPIFRGCGVAMITAFNDSGIDFAHQKKIIEHLIAGGIDAIVVCGTTGEPSTMSEKEREALVKFTVKEVKGRVKVIAGSGTNCTATSVAFSKKCEKMGVDALMVVTPYYNKCNDDGLIAHFKAISDVVNLPIMAYNVPSRTHVNITPTVAVSLSEIKNVVAIKEASGDIHQISEAILLTEGKLDVYSGDDSLALPAISKGALGVVSVVANVIPKKVSEMARLALNGDFNGANEIHSSLAPIIRQLFCTVNPIPVKKAMHLLGLCENNLRLPLTELDKENTEKLKANLVDLGLYEKK